MRRFKSFAAATALLMGIAVPAGAARPFPDVIDLPGGFFPEGIAVGAGHTVYAGSLAGGAIWKGDLRTGEGDILVTPIGAPAVGMDYDESTGILFVAGGPAGVAYLYDGDTGESIDIVPLAGPGGFVNDVIVANGAAYFTNSFVDEIYVLPLTPNGTVAGDAATLPLTGDFDSIPGAFNANGIEATADGSMLIVVSAGVGEVYTVDPATGFATEIDLGGATVNGDGLVLVGKTLYAVEGSKNQITEIALSPDLSSGEVIGALTSPDYVVPTTAARFGNGLYAVNAKFGTPPTPDTPYEIVRVDR